MDGVDIEILTDERPFGHSGSTLRARSIIINGKETIALEGAEFSLHTTLGKPGILQATFTLVVKSINFKGISDA